MFRHYTISHALSLKTRKSLFLSRTVGWTHGALLLRAHNLVVSLCFRLTLLVGLALHLQVDGGQTQLVGLLRGQVFGRRLLLLLLFDGVSDAEAAPHLVHLMVKLLAGDLVVKAQPAELDLHPEGRMEGEK